MPCRSCCALLVATCVSLSAQSFDTSLYRSMRWRQIGPFRAGRVTAVSGHSWQRRGLITWVHRAVASGRQSTAVSIWTPVSDSVPISSIGAVAVAQSNPNIVYFGTGDVSMVGGSVNMGDGVYKSTDAGKTWQHVGLEETEHIGGLWIDPKNPDIVLVAALGRTYSKNNQRGIFKTTDGGKSWRNVLHKDDVTGAVDLVLLRPASTKRLATPLSGSTTCGARRRRAAIESAGFAGIYKTTDSGDTWTQLAEGSAHVGRLRAASGVAVSNDGQKVFAIVAGGGGFGGGGGGGGSNAGGLYRSDDGGAHAGAGARIGFAHHRQWLFQSRFPGSEEFRCGLCGADFRCIARKMAATPSRRTRARRAETTITRCGSTRPTACA